MSEDEFHAVNIEQMRAVSYSPVPCTSANNLAGINPEFTCEGIHDHGILPQHESLPTEVVSQPKFIESRAPKSHESKRV